MKDCEVTTEGNQLVHQQTVQGNFHIKIKDLQENGCAAE